MLSTQTARSGNLGERQPWQKCAQPHPAQHKHTQCNLHTLTCTILAYLETLKYIHVDKHTHIPTHMYISWKTLARAHVHISNAPKEMNARKHIVHTHTHPHTQLYTHIPANTNPY